LDLTVFSLLKTAYRKYVGIRNLITDSTLIGKCNFFLYYQKAKSEALTRRNIISGWRAIGLWPLNSAKPLINRLLLENNNQLEEETRKRKGEDPLPDWHATNSVFKPPTPQKFENIRNKVHSISQLGKAFTSIARIFFRKVSKAVDQRDSLIAQYERRIQQLETKVEQLEPRKHRKIKASPNSKFVGIEAIKIVQHQVGDC